MSIKYEWLPGGILNILDQPREPSKVYRATQDILWCLTTNSTLWFCFGNGTQWCETLLKPPQLPLHVEHRFMTSVLAGEKKTSFFCRLDFERAR